MDNTGEQKGSLTAAAKAVDDPTIHVGILCEIGAYFVLAGASSEYTVQVTPLDSSMDLT